MKRPLNVLMSAYACEPGKGSEPEVGWQWSLQMARYHNVTVLTRANNQAVIERSLDQLPEDQPRPSFHYHDLGPASIRLKRLFRMTSLYYERWQRSAVHVVRQMQSIHRYDLLHHVSFASFRHSAAVFGHGLPSIWGPVGGIESCPWRLLAWAHPPSAVRETARNLNNLWHTRFGRGLRGRVRQATRVLATTPEMQRTIEALGSPATLLPTIGIQCHQAVHPEIRLPRTPLKLLFVGNLLDWKGLEFAIRAVHQADNAMTLTLVGAGHYENTLKRIACSLGVQDRIIFLGRLPRASVLELYPEYDVLLFPSLHDSGGYAVIEAMWNGMPVICLNRGGPAVSVTEECGIKVEVGSRSQIVSGLATALRRYDQNRELIRSHGEAAIQRVGLVYDWEHKGEQLNQIYLEAIADWGRTDRAAP